jgi:hypothetical protein
MREIFDHYDVVYGFEYHPNVAWPVYLTKAARGYRGNFFRFESNPLFEELIDLLGPTVFFRLV